MIASGNRSRFLFFKSTQRGKNMATAKVVPVVTMGRNSLDIALFKKFLSMRNSILPDDDKRNFLACYNRCLAKYPVPKIEVKVEAIL